MMNEIAEIKKQLIENLINAQDELYECLKDNPLSEQFKMEKKLGRKKGYKEHYIWIDVESKKYPTKKYCLGLCREQIDSSTGNIHHDFRRLQMSKTPFLHGEKGGEVNPRPIAMRGHKPIIENMYMDNLETLEKIYPKNQRAPLGKILIYLTTNCFPRADLQGLMGDDAPWGHSDFKCEYGSEKEKITAEDMSEKIMDRTNDDYYDPRKVASFFLQLCVHDATMCEK